MPLVILKKIEEPNISCSFATGEHIIGRGSQLQCESKKVSRKHGLLIITENDGISLRSIHNNPCFYQSNQSENIQIITFNNKISLKTDDRISLSLDHGWFTVQINDEDINTENSEINSSTNIPGSRKRLHEIENTENDKSLSNKKTKTDEEQSLENQNENEVTIKTEPDNDNEYNINSNTSTNANVDAVVVKTEIKIEPEPETAVITDEISTTPVLVKQEPVENEETSTEVQNNTVEIVKVKLEKDSEKASDKNEADKSTDINAPSTSGVNNSNSRRRERCWYGSACYRKNVMHRQEFSHPKDADYDSDPNDSRPICCYGIACYRRNREHRQRYRHPGQDNVPKNPKKQQTGGGVGGGNQPSTTTTITITKRVRKKPTTYNYDDDDEDDYDLNDPFINDGSSDEYEPDSSDTESDLDSQSQEFDNEETKRLLKEARNFTKK